jgi:hypothetical protein
MHIKRLDGNDSHEESSRDVRNEFFARIGNRGIDAARIGSIAQVHRMRHNAMFNMRRGEVVM